MRTIEELNQRIEHASMELIEAQVRLQAKQRLGGSKAIKSAQMDVAVLMSEINSLQWAAGIRTDEQSGYNRKLQDA
jgi:hypothetical protein